MRLADVPPATRVGIYQVIRAVFVLLPTLGIAIPGDQGLWDQLILALLGLSGAAGTTLAIAHTPPGPEQGQAPDQ